MKSVPFQYTSMLNKSQLSDEWGSPVPLYYSICLHFLFPKELNYGFNITLNQVLVKKLDNQEEEDDED